RPRLPAAARRFHEHAVGRGALRARGPRTPDRGPERIETGRIRGALDLAVGTQPGPLRRDPRATPEAAGVATGPRAAPRGSRVGAPPYGSHPYTCGSPAYTLLKRKRPTLKRCIGALGLDPRGRRSHRSPH